MLLTYLQDSHKVAMQNKISIRSGLSLLCSVKQKVFPLNEEVLQILVSMHNDNKSVADDYTK